MKMNELTVGELFQIRKGRKAPQVFDTQLTGSKQYIQIDDLRANGNSVLKFTLSISTSVIAW